jgi:hypothetical protein
VIWLDTLVVVAITLAFWLFVGWALTTKRPRAPKHLRLWAYYRLWRRRRSG